MAQSSKTVRSSKKPSGASLTSGTQTWNLKRLREQREGAEEWKSSVEWLEWRSLEVCGLTLSHLLSHCSTPTTSHSEHSVQQESSTAPLTDFETQLYQATEMYHSRIRWLNQGSRRVFGMVKGSRLGVLIDTSDVTGCEERLGDLQHELLLLLEEQLSKKQQLYFLSFGREVTGLWEHPRKVTPLRLQEAEQWLLQLSSCGGCDLRRAVETLCRHTHLDSLLIILTSHPDQDADEVLPLMAHVVQEMSLSVHVVSYNSYSPAAIETVKNIARVTGGRYHLFSSALGVVDSSSDLEPLWAEIKSARDVLHYIQDRRRGLKDTTLSVQSEISTGLDSLSLSDLPDCSTALCIQPPAALPVTSTEWLKTHGLKAKKLSLYQVLSPNVYTPLEGYVPILGKSVHSTVHKKAMVQFEWHDGTAKNVHVDLPSLHNYQKRLLDAQRVLENRVLWLTSAGSRQIWGTVCEQRVQVLLDMSELSSCYQLHIRHAVRLLLQEQLPCTHSFNITVFGSDIQTWRDHMVPPTHENLQDAWMWIQGLGCGGERNTLAALRCAVETEPVGEESLTRGLYLFTTGVPDHDPSAVSVSAYVSEVCDDGLRLHVCFFTGEHESTLRSPYHPVTRADTALALRGLARVGSGRFHWITDTGIVESDDVIALIAEMEKGADYWQKCCELVESLVQRSFSRDPEEASSHDASSPSESPPAGPRIHRLPPPRPTQLSLARLENKDGKSSPTWRPSSAKATIPPAPVDGLEMARRVKSAKYKKTKVSHSVFYMENGSMGAVFKTYLKPKSVQKITDSVKLPKHEDICSTKQWLKRVGIRSLKLDLHKLVSGPECTHRKKMVRTVRKSVSAKYCAIFPSVELNGCVRHLFLSPGELKQYLVQTERVLQRYAERMKWLLSGSRRVFGCVLETDVCVMLDVSGSMSPCLPELQRDLVTLVWEQLHARGVRMNLVAFSGEVSVWQGGLVEASEDRCREAEKWLGHLNTHGNTSILHALQTGCAFGDSMGVYLVSDGRSDCSFSMVLREAESLTRERRITIHTITLQCQDSEAMEFLKSLAHKSRGRFHQMPSHTDTTSANEILSRGFSEAEDAELPAFEGDDLKRLKEEIEKLRLFQKQAKSFREILLERNADGV